MGRLVSRKVQKGNSRPAQLESDPRVALEYLLGNCLARAGGEQAGYSQIALRDLWACIRTWHIMVLRGSPHLFSVPGYRFRNYRLIYYHASCFGCDLSWAEIGIALDKGNYD
jgi:hypothetical protein